ncbi:hypothetical protein DS745_12270 [Anaerobacillus alkaliphilus]|uniref:PPM-type phosphatase domain-containing protein n=1 Tax=Anaerobacillus alkaliphilus TaxID=1548597 RepID=A0A4V1LGC7_9BACI|nr:PP2C family protein-serine/threonine phosphatase [Anaerobacillus alkaliphilus]RXJ00302.1 hypothetical protein DS745_12270 [Anaerobacillus alkaliphilus]
MKITVQRRLAIGFLIFYITFYYVWIIGFQAHATWLVTGGNLLHLVAPFIASLLLFIPVTRVKDENRLYWLFLFLGCISYFIGQVVWNYYELVLNIQTPFPSIPDLFYLLQAVLFFTAIMYKLKLEFNKFESLQYQMGVLTILLIVMFFSLEYLFIPFFKTTYSLVELVFLLAYPVSDIGILFALLVLNYYTVFKSHVRILILGTSILVFTHIAYSFMLVTDSYQTGSLIDPLFSLGIFLVGMSGLYSESSLKNKIESQNRHYYTRMVFPLLITIVLLLWFVLHKTINNQIDLIDIGVLIGTILMVIRIVIFRLENDDLLSRKLEELHLAKSVQKGLLPSDISNESIGTTSYFKPSEELSGDLYYWEKINEKKYGILIIDVMGHGLSSSIISLSIKSLLHGLVTKVSQPSSVMTELSNHMDRMFGQADNPYYFTAIYILVDNEEKKISYVNAGHPSVLWNEKGKGVMQLESTCPPIGLFENSPIVESEFRYEKSGRFVLYTDGFLETVWSTQTKVSCLEKFLLEHEAKDIHEFKDKLLSKCTQKTEDDKCLVIVDIKK